MFFALCRAFGPPAYRLLLLLLTRISLISVKISESLWISNQRVVLSLSHCRAFLLFLCNSCCISVLHPTKSRSRYLCRMCIYTQAKTWFMGIFQQRCHDCCCCRCFCSRLTIWGCRRNAWPSRHLTLEGAGGMLDAVTEGARYGCGCREILTVAFYWYLIARI